MNEYFLYINNELLHKLEFFIYDHDQSGLMYNEAELVINFTIGNKNDLTESKNRKNIYKLRSLLSYHKGKVSLQPSEIETAIEIFLMNDWRRYFEKEMSKMQQPIAGRSAFLFTLLS